MDDNSKESLEDKVDLLMKQVEPAPDPEPTDVPSWRKFWV